MRRLVIYGAGEAGSQVAKQVRQLPNNQYDIIGFVDDFKKETMNGSYIDGIDIISFEQARNKKPDTVVVAIPSLSLEGRKQALQRCKELSTTVLFLPSVSEILGGTVKISHLRQQNEAGVGNTIETNKFDEEALQLYTGSNVLVTGGGVSIGSQIVKQLMSIPDCHVTLIDHSEYNLYKITEELEQFVGNKLNIILGSILDEELLRNTFSKTRFDYVLHTAAYKHVPLIETNIVAGLKNNILGTDILVKYSLKACVKSFLLVSTDKAVRPTNIMGASKRICEQIVLQANCQNTEFNIVRFGNVLNSSGSVVPKFRNQIMGGGPVTLTHPDVTRFFMTIEQAVYLVICTAKYSNHRNLFVLDMGEPKKILDMAKRLIAEYGFDYTLDDSKILSSSEILIKITGLRPGEKLYEELVLGAELTATKVPGLLKGQEPVGIEEPITDLLRLLRGEPHSVDKSDLRELIRCACPEYKNL